MDVGQRRRDGQPRRPSPAPTPGGYLHRIAELDDPIYVYKDRDGVLVTDDLDGVTRPVGEVVSNLRADRKIYKELQQQQALLSDGVLVTDDLVADGSKPPVADVQRASPGERDHSPPPRHRRRRRGGGSGSQDQSSTTTPSQAQFVKDLPDKAFLDNKLQQQAQTRAETEPNVLASKELLDTTTLEGLSITRPSSLPRTTSPLKEELIPPPQLLQALDKARASADLFPTQSTDSAYHYSALEEPDMFSSNKFIVSDASSTRAEVLTHSPTPPISALKFAGWNHQFFIRVDHDEVFHTYPELDGPFQSLEEAEDAIFLRLDELEDPKMCTNDGLSRAEIAIRDALYWPDGTRKYSSRSNPDEDHMELLVQALLDKYNEENKLLGDRAYQVGKVVSFQEVYEGHDGWYYHLNCTRKTKGGVDGQFFAEVLKKIRGELEEFELTCLHMLEPVDNGTCYGCTNDTIGMKHPIDAGKYKGGHNRSWPRYFGRHQLLDINDIDKDNPLLFPKDMDDRMKAEEKRIRYFFEEHHVAKPDARKTRASLDKSQGRSVKYVVRYQQGVN